MIFILILPNAGCCRLREKSSWLVGLPAGALSDQLTCRQQLPLLKDAAPDSRYPSISPQATGLGRPKELSSIGRACVWTRPGTWRLQGGILELFPGYRT